jgi:hypothetical protein
MSTTAPTNKRNELRRLLRQESDLKLTLAHMREQIETLAEEMGDDRSRELAGLPPRQPKRETRCPHCGDARCDSLTSALQCPTLLARHLPAPEVALAHVE